MKTTLCPSYGGMGYEYYDKMIFNPSKERYPAQTITDADYANDIALLKNLPSQAETLLHSLERIAGGIGLHVKAGKTEYMCFNQKGDISTLKGGPLKLVDKFTYLGSSGTSTEDDINEQQAKAWTALDMISVIWNSDLTYKIKRGTRLNFLKLSPLGISPTEKIMNALSLFSTP